MYRGVSGSETAARVAANPINAPMFPTIDLPPVDEDYNDAEVLRVALQTTAYPSAHLLLSNGSVEPPSTRHPPVDSLDLRVGRLSLSAVHPPAPDPSIGKTATSGGAVVLSLSSRHQSGRRVSPTPQHHARRHPSSLRVG